MKKNISLLLIAASLLFSGCEDGFYDVYNDFTGPVQSVEMRSSASVVVGSTERLTAVVYPSMTPNKNVSWMSDNPAVASVDSTGLVTGNTVDQSTIIRVTTEDGGFTAECLVTVVPVPIPVETWAVDNSISVGRGLQVQLTRDFTPANATNTEMSWRSSNSAVAAVDSSGLVIGVATGTAVITVTSVHWGLSASCDVTVVDQALTVTYNANGGSGTVPVDSNTYTAGATVTAGGGGSLSMAGHTFSHWNTKSDGTGSSVNQNDTFTIGVQNVTLYAIYSSTYTVTYSANGGSGTVPVDSNNYTAGAPVTSKSASSLSMAGYTFSHWNTMSNGSGNSIAQNAIFVMGTQNVTLYAQWNPVTIYYITFDKNDNAATGTMPEQGIPGGTTANLTSVQFAKTGWIFAGWATSPTGPAAYADGANYPMGTSNVTLFAKWNPPVVYAIGDRGPAGGWVFYDKGVYSDGWRYLEAAVDDSPMAYAYSPQGQTVGASSTAVGGGYSNTLAIINTYPSIVSAAKYCVTYNGGGMTDWFLPSTGELGLMYNRGIIPPEKFYWSSSEYDLSNSYYFDSGGINYFLKTNTCDVRPIRAF